MTTTTNETTGFFASILNKVTESSALEVGATVIDNTIDVVDQTITAAILTTGCVSKSALVLATGARMGAEAAYSVLPTTVEESEEFWSDMFSSDEEETK